MYGCLLLKVNCNVNLTSPCGCSSSRAGQEGTIQLHIFHENQFNGSLNIAFRYGPYSGVAIQKVIVMFMGVVGTHAADHVTSVILKIHNPSGFELFFGDHLVND